MKPNLQNTQRCTCFLKRICSNKSNRPLKPTNRTTFQHTKITENSSLLDVLSSACNWTKLLEEKKIVAILEVILFPFSSASKIHTDERCSKSKVVNYGGCSALCSHLNCNYSKSKMGIYFSCPVLKRDNKQLLWVLNGLWLLWVFFFLFFSFSEKRR